MIKCHECGSDISSEAASCPKCGAKPKTKGTWKKIFLGFIFFAGLLIWLFSGQKPAELPATQAQASPGSPNSSDPGKKTEELSYSLPIYTSRGAVVCPFSVVLEKREDKGLKAATDAAISIFGRSEAIQKAGCEEWKEGIRLYISESEKGNAWQEASLFPGGATNKLVFEPYLTNKESSAAVENPAPMPDVPSNQQSNSPQSSIQAEPTGEAAATQADGLLSDCLLDKVKLGGYTSTDGGVSAILLLRKCSDQERIWHASCMASGGNNDGDCNLKAGILAQASIKLSGQ